MEEWIDKIFNGYDSFGGITLTIIIVIFSLIFVFGWIWLILDWISLFILETIKNIKEKFYGYDYDRNKRFEKIEDKIEDIFQSPFKIKSIIYKKIIHSFPNIKIEKRSKIKGFLIWNLITLLIISLWYSSYDPINNFKLITNSIVVDGYITKSIQSSEIEEINDGRTTREVFKFTYDYEFVSKEGITYKSNEEVKGKEPEDFYDLENNPIQVKVNYLYSNPKKSRVFKYTNEVTTIYEFFRYTILIGMIISIVWILISYNYFLKKIVILLPFILITLISNSQKNNSNSKTFKNSQIGIEFKYPLNWETGTPSISNIYWVGLPNYPSEGNVVLRVVTWEYKVDIKNYLKEQYKKDILSSSIYYKDLEFIEFNNQFKISGIDGIFSYYKGSGNYVKSDYYEMVVQWWKNNLLYTLQGQFKEPPLTKNQVEEFKNLIRSIKMY